jgi:hypothetical protein
MARIPPHCLRRDANLGGVDQDPLAVVLVEGMSDRQALLTLARRRCQDLDAKGIAVQAMGGATNIGAFLDRYGPHGADLRLAGLCDAGEEGSFRRGLERAGLGSNLTRAAMEELGFFVCVLDLEDELIRALGPELVEAIIEAEGDLASFRIFQNQPAQRTRTAHQQLRRFLGTRSGRKIRYASILVGALELTCVPSPLAAVLDHVGARSGR